LFFLLLKLNYEGQEVIGAVARACWTSANCTCGAIDCGGGAFRAPIRPIRAKLHSSDAKDAAN